MTMDNIDNATKPKALVIGATGGIGGEVAHALLAAGWRVTGLARSPANAARRAGWVGGIEWIAGDAMKEADVVAAAQGAKIIFHGANPPGYKNWRGLAIPMLRHAITAASAAGARLIFPGNVYNFGPDAGAVVTETSPQNPRTRKGRIRVEMEAMLETSTKNGTRALVIRAGDFFGPHQPASWFKDAMVKPGKPLKSVTYPGVHDAGHAWAYLPDLAATIARLAAIEGSPGLRAPELRRPLVAARRANGASHRARRRQPETADPSSALGTDLCRRDGLHLHARGTGNALFMAGTIAPGQHQAMQPAWRGTAYEFGTGHQRHARHAGLPANGYAITGAVY